jgi:hypothetical protein
MHDGSVRELAGQIGLAKMDGHGQLQAHQERTWTPLGLAIWPASSISGAHMDAVGPRARVTRPFCGHRSDIYDTRSTTHALDVFGNSGTLHRGERMMSWGAARCLGHL